MQRPAQEPLTAAVSREISMDAVNCTTGESLASIERHDVSIEQATTPSLEALKAFTTGVRLHGAGRPDQALPHLERATRLDPEFALAYAPA